MTASLNWGQLFQLEAPKLRRFLRRFGPAVSAEDITQDSFARLAAEPNDVTSPSAYLFRVARNLAVDELRRSKKCPVDPVSNLASLDCPSSAPSPEDAVIAGDEADHLHTALAELPEHQRTALILFKVEGFTHKEIGRRLGVSHRTVERYIADALKHCHQALAGLPAQD